MIPCQLFNLEKVERSQLLILEAALAALEHILIYFIL